MRMRRTSRSLQQLQTSRRSTSNLDHFELRLGFDHPCNGGATDNYLLSIAMVSDDFEELPCELRLANDRHKRSDAKFMMVWNWNSSCRSFGLQLHHDVAAVASHLNETVLRKDLADLSTRKPAKPSQP